MSGSGSGFRNFYKRLSLLDMAHIVVRQQARCTCTSRADRQAPFSTRRLSRRGRIGSLGLGLLSPDCIPSCDIVMSMDLIYAICCYIKLEMEFSRGKRMLNLSLATHEPGPTRRSCRTKVTNTRLCIYKVSNFYRFLQLHSFLANFYTFSCLLMR